MTDKKTVKVKKSPKPKTYVVLVLDESGSLLSCKEAARNHFNEQVQTIKETSKG